MKMLGKSFNTDFQVKFHQADPAGIMYFANIFTLAHDCFEEFIVSAGLKWQDWFLSNPSFVPIRHAESDYFKPFLPGQRYQIKATVAKISASSFQMSYEFFKADTVHAQVKMVHTFVDPKTNQKMPIPEEMKKILLPYLQVQTTLKP